MLYSFNIEENQKPDSKAFHRNTLDSATGLCDWSPVIFYLLICTLVEELIAKKHHASLGKLTFSLC